MRNAESKELNIFKNEYIRLNVSSNDTFECESDYTFKCIPSDDTFKCINSDDTFECASWWHIQMCIVMTHSNVPNDNRFKCASEWGHIWMCCHDVLSDEHLNVSSDAHSNVSPDDTFKQIYSFLNIFSSLLSAFLMCQNFWFVPPGHYFYNVNASLVPSGM